jgi:hypothetical protein
MHKCTIAADLHATNNTDKRRISSTTTFFQSSKRSLIISSLAILRDIGRVDEDESRLLGDPRPLRTHAKAHVCDVASNKTHLASGLLVFTAQRRPTVNFRGITGRSQSRSNASRGLPRHLLGRRDMMISTLRFAEQFDRAITLHNIAMQKHRLRLRDASPHHEEARL